MKAAAGVLLLAGLWLAAPGAAHAPPGAAPSHARAGSLPPGAILFTSSRVVEGPSHLYALDANTAALKDLGVPVGLGQTHWSRDGRWIAFSRRVGQSAYVFSVIRGDGFGRRDVARSEDPSYSTGGQFAWAPDGRRIAFADTRRDRTAIYTVELGRNRRVRLTDPAAGIGDTDPAWSPDGRRIAFVRTTGPCHQGLRVRCHHLYIANGDGSKPRRIGSFDRGIAHDWSPDGKRIAVALYCCASGPAFVINADGTNPRRIAEVSASIAWSPNGRWIAIGATRIVRPDGTGARQVGNKEFGTPSWSPDSRALVLNVDGDIWVVPIDGSGERRLTEGWRYGYYNSGPEWNPRGLSAARLGGTSVSAANPTDSVVEGGALRTTRAVVRLSADGPRVGIAYAGGKVEAWDPPAASITRFDYLDPSYGFALAGERIAGTHLRASGPRDSWYLRTATVSVPRSFAAIWPVLGFPTNTPLEHLAGDRALLVGDIWGPCQISWSPPCAREPKPGGRLYRIEETRAMEIASDRGPLTLLSVDGDRILVDRENGALQLFRADGTPLYAITYGPAKLLGATLEGNDLVALTTEGLSHHDAGTGDLRHHRRLAAADAQLADVQNGVAVYLTGSEIHLHRLGDGHEAVIRPEGRGPVLAELEASGLFYSYAVEDATFPGRVAFVPFDQLPLR